MVDSKRLGEFLAVRLLQQHRSKSFLEETIVSLIDEIYELELDSDIQIQMDNDHRITDIAYTVTGIAPDPSPSIQKMIAVMHEEWKNKWIGQTNSLELEDQIFDSFRDLVYRWFTLGYMRDLKYMERETTTDVH